MQQTIKCLTALLKSAVTGKEISGNTGYKEQFDSIIKLARAHEVSGIVAYAMIKNGLDSQTDSGIAEKEMFKASFNDTKNTYTYELAADLLSGAGIDFVPLKGFVIKNYYPERFMRTSCDVDILVHKEDFDRAVQTLKNAGFSQVSNVRYHDVSLLYGNTNLELHFSVCEDMSGADAYLEKIWDNLEAAGGRMYLETKDFFAFHHIAHMAHHFVCGGCGIRTFLDLWLLMRNNAFDPKVVRSTCEKAEIGRFYDAVTKLTRVWFEDGEHDGLTLKMESYLLSGGAYGSRLTGTAAGTVKHGGKFRYIVSMAFPPYKGMKILYPVLEKAPVLLPFCYIARVFGKTFCKSGASARKRVKGIEKQDVGFVKEVVSLMDDLELN